MDDPCWAKDNALRLAQSKRKVQEYYEGVTVVSFLANGTKMYALLWEGVPLSGEGQEYAYYFEHKIWNEVASRIERWENEKQERANNG